MERRGRARMGERMQVRRPRSPPCMCVARAPLHAHPGLPPPLHSSPQVLRDSHSHQPRQSPPLRVAPLFETLSGESESVWVSVRVCWGGGGLWVAQVDSHALPINHPPTHPPTPRSHARAPDLASAGAVMRRLLAVPWYRQHLAEQHNNHQEVRARTCGAAWVCLE